MSQYRLLRSQKNAIYEALKARQINHFHFELKDAEQMFKLFHKETGYFFEIKYDFAPWHYGITFSPGNNVWTAQIRSDSWSDVFAAAKNWAQYLEREISQPDYWNNIIDGSVFTSFKSASDSKNNAFSDAEKIDIKNKLNQIETFLHDNYELSDESKKLITEKLDRLEQLAECQGRMDWLHTVIGVAFTIIIGVGLAPDQAKEFAQFVGNILAQIFGGTIPLLP